jgi:Zn-finger nucleic acid-binding protein
MMMTSYHDLCGAYLCDRRANSRRKLHTTSGTFAPADRARLGARTYPSRMPHPCPRCGTTLGRVAADDDFGGVLAPQSYVLTCGGCGGIWLDNAATQEIVHGVIRQRVIEIADETSERAKESVEGDPYREPRVGTGACPMCASAMTEVRTTAAREGIEGLVLEICARHGTWFDHDELRALAEAAAARATQRNAEAARHAAQERAEMDAAVEAMHGGTAVPPALGAIANVMSVALRPSRRRFTV